MVVMAWEEAVRVMAWKVARKQPRHFHTNHTLQEQGVKQQQQQQQQQPQEEESSILPLPPGKSCVVLPP